MNYFKRKWNIESNWQLAIILLVFAATGFSYLALKPFVLEWLGYHHIEERWLRILIYILVALPVYQAILLTLAAIAGQWNFFWPFIKNMNKRMFIWTRRKN